MNRLCVLAVLLAGRPAAAQHIRPWSGDAAGALPGARASLTVDGPWLPAALSAEGMLEIYDESAARPQFVERADGAKLLLHIDPDKLGLYTLANAVLATSAGASDAAFDERTPGVQLRAGSHLREVGPDENGRRRVQVVWRWKGGSFQVEGWVASDKIGKIYRSGFLRMPDFKPDVTAPGRFRLLDRPGGRAFAFSDTQPRVELMTLEHAGKHALVRTGHGVVGWIAARQLKKLRRDDGDDTLERASVLGCSPCTVGPDTLPKDTPLYDRPDGARIGEVAYGFSLQPAERKGDWMRFDVSTRFGKLSVWAKQPTGGPASSKPGSLGP